LFAGVCGFSNAVGFPDNLLDIGNRMSVKIRRRKFRVPEKIPNSRYRCARIVQMGSEAMPESMKLPRRRKSRCFHAFPETGPNPSIINGFPGRFRHPGPVHP